MPSFRGELYPVEQLAQSIVEILEIDEEKAKKLSEAIQAFVIEQIDDETRYRFESLESELRNEISDVRSDIRSIESS